MSYFPSLSPQAGAYLLDIFSSNNFPHIVFLWHLLLFFKKYKIFMYFSLNFSIHFQRLLKLEGTNKVIQFWVSHSTCWETETTQMLNT